MNNLYFACKNCKIYIDAGYRWAAWELEDAGIVSRRKKVSVNAVLSAREYWNPPEPEGSSRWLVEEIFPPLRQFLTDHGSHRIIFGEVEDFAPEWDDQYLVWMQIGYLLSETPRYLVEVLGFTTWQQVVEYMENMSIGVPAWYQDNFWDSPTSYEKGKRKFEELVRTRKGD